MDGVEPAWIVTRYHDVKMVLSDPRFVNDKKNVPGTPPPIREQVLQAFGIPPEYQKYRLLRMDAADGAEHVRLRRLVSKAFTVRRIAQLRPQVEAIAAELLDRLPGHAIDGVVDLVPHFAHPLPSAVLCELVGIPKADWPQWREWYEVVIPGTSLERNIQVWRELIPYIQSLFEQRRAEPRDDLLSVMISGQDEDRLTETEMIAMTVAFGLSGPRTTGSFIGKGVLALLTHPEQRALLRDKPELMPRAVDELLRCVSPTQVVPRIRYAAEDVEIGGTTVRKGEAVWIVLTGANHDPRRFDNPDGLDITREPDRRAETHVAFGGGAHHCLGAAQASQDAEVAFETLFRRFPNLTLAVDPDELEYEPMAFQSRLKTLPVRL
jgi:cytochrome P450